MEKTCVDCHDAHPYSSKRDWKVGDVRGIQEIDISQPIAGNAFSFRYLLAYFVFMGVAAVAFIAMQHRQAGTIRSMNRELETANDFSPPCR
jgi:adenylate cyclase